MNQTSEYFTVPDSPFECMLAGEESWFVLQSSLQTEYSPNGFSLSTGLTVEVDDHDPNGSSYVTRGTSDGTFTSPGAKRSGFVEYSYSTQGGTVTGFDGSHYSGGSAAGITDGLHTYKSPACNGSCNFTGKEPFELGTPFTALVTMDEKGVFVQNGLFAGGFNVDFSFALFEADGVTPVDAFIAADDISPLPLNLATPEPAPLGLVASSSFLLGFSLLKRAARAS